jgi:cobalt-zinc-cadmium efflux system membrane fusion protein
MNRLHLVPFLLVLSAGACARKEAAGARDAVPDGEVRLTEAQLKASALELGAASVAPIVETARLAGRVAFDDLRVTHVFSPVTGRVERIFANPGDKVAKGAPLAEIDSPDLGNAMSDWLKAAADQQAAAQEFERQRDLFEVHAASQRDLDTARDAAERAKAELDRARDKVRLLQAEPSRERAVSQRYVLRAPLGGEVLARTLNPGTEVQGQYGGNTVVELFLIGDIDEVWVTADVHEMDLGRIRVGQAVTASVVTYPGETFMGRVQWMSDVLDPVTHTAKVRVSIPNRDHRLRPEMYATLTVTVGEKPALAVPRSALIRLGDVMVVYVSRGKLPDGRLVFQRRRVAVPSELPADGLVPVSSGLAEGDIVVERGGILLTES